MKRLAILPAVTVAVCLSATHAFAQGAKAAAPTTPAPASPAKFVRPVKGTAYLLMLQPTKSKRVGTDVVTIVTVKNISGGAIHLLKVDEYWYDKTRKKMVSASMSSVRKPLNPGEVVDVTMKTPWNSAMDTSQYFFSHANGKVEVKAVKKFE